MNTPAPLISRTSIFIISYFLVNSGLSRQLPPALSMSWVMLGTTGFLSYFGLEWAASRRAPAAQTISSAG